MFIDDDNYNSNKQKPNGKGSFTRRGNTKFNLDCQGMDIAPMHIFENQVIPVGIHNISKSFRPNLATIPVLSLCTKFIPKWDKTKTNFTFEWFNDFQNKMNTKVYFQKHQIRRF